MPRKAVRESDLRSLDRQSMYSIFSPLDANERLPRELVHEGRRYRKVGRRELVAFMWFPVVFLLLTIFGWFNAGGLVAAIVSSLVLGALFFFAFWHDRK